MRFFNSLILCLASLLWEAPEVAAQESQMSVRGRVLAEDGEELAGVSIRVKDANQSTFSNARGEFSLDIQGSGKTLVFTYVGFATREVVVNDQRFLEVRLKASEELLEEVVVIGYGTVRKSDLTGSVASVRSEQLRAMPVTSVDQALQGRAAGVQVVQTSGVPGAGTNIRVRGTTSVNASSEPLYVIDGMLINNDQNEMAIASRGPRISPLASLNPGDIESVEILKDASATAIYGSRGANGVVLITTKKGKTGEGQISFDMYYGVQEPSRKLELLNAEQFASLVNEANINAGRNPVYVNPGTLGQGTDWQNELFRTAPMANYQLSFSGGNDRTRYAVSGGYFTQEGIVTGSDFQRFSFRNNIESDVKKYLTLGANVSYSHMESNGVLTGPGQIVPGVIAGALQFNPIATVYDPTQTLGYTFEHLLKTNIANPVAEAREYQSVNKTGRFLSNVYAQVKFSPALSFRSSFGVDLLRSKSDSFGPYGLKRTQNSLGEASAGSLDAMTWIATNTLNYNRDFAANNLNFVLGTETQQFKNTMFAVNVFDFPDGRTGFHNLGAGQNPQPPANAESEWSLVSFLARVNYTLDRKYLFTVSGRSDGSSKFAEGNKFGFFPSAAFAWRAIEEGFMQDQRLFSDLKFRASYGVTGNQSIAPYTSLALITSFGEGVFNNGPGAPIVYYGREPLSYPNKDLKWETTRQVNLGIDAAVLNGRVHGSVEFYDKHTYDLLLNTPIPVTSGFQYTLLNVGNVRNRGLDISVNSTNLTGALKWETGLNFSVNRNRITNLAGGNDVLLAGGNILREGQPIGTFYGYVFDGIYQSDEEAASSAVIAGQKPAAGDRKYKDISGPDGKPDGVINDLDRTIIGSAQPRFTYGIHNQLTYSNFELSFFFQGSQGNQMVNMNMLNLGNMNGQQNVLLSAYEGRWTPENKSNTYARALATSSDNIFSSRFVEDASYLRLRNIRLAYSFQPEILQKLNVGRLSVYASASNLLTFTRYTGYDPEGNAYGGTTNIVGVDDGNYPQAKTFLFGLNLGL